ncbi:hypothetical protein IJD15_07600 [bacterium]|nr:hypothetical protein [bacterium]
MKKILVVTFILFLFPLSSFAIGTKSTMEKVMNSWMGEHIDTIIEKWGYPTSEKNIANRKLYYWSQSSYSVSGNQYGVYGGEATCTRIFEVNKFDKVINWQWQGNNCPALYLTSKKWVNPNKNPWIEDKENNKITKYTKRFKSMENKK